MIGIVGLMGGGPWRILPECPGNTHNSGRAARGVGRESRCICPHARDLLVAQRKAAAVGEAARMRLRHATARSDPRTRLQPPMPEPVETRSPDFYAGLCRLPENLAIADGGQNDQASYKGIADRNAAKELCGACPLRQACKTWVTREEKPAGSWGGVWGGMDPWNRKGLELIITKGRAEVIPYVSA